MTAAGVNLKVWGWPAGIGAASAVGLVSALVGDGGFDALSWALLGVPAACGLWGLWRGRRIMGDRPAPPRTAARPPA